MSRKQISVCDFCGAERTKGTLWFFVETKRIGLATDFRFGRMAPNEIAADGNQDACGEPCLQKAIKEYLVSEGSRSV